MYKVLVPRVISGKGIAYLMRQGCDIVLGRPACKEDPMLSECDAILAGGVGGVFYDNEVFEKMSKCKVISCFSAGTEMIDLLAAERHGVYITNSGDANSNAVAEHVLFLILACAKNAKQMAKAAASESFSIRDKVHNSELAGKSITLIGCGNIGGRVAKKCIYGLDMNVYVYDPYVDVSKLDKNVQKLETIEEAVEVADYVSLQLHLTDQTRGMFNMDLFKRMRPTAYFINASRGQLVVESDLIAALEEGLIAGAGLDVYEKEPPSSDNKLLKMDNVIAMPHAGANTIEALERMELYAAEDIWRVLSGVKPRFPRNNPR